VQNLGVLEDSLAHLLRRGAIGLGTNHRGFLPR
jgi:hypothetical protein